MLFIMQTVHVVIECLINVEDNIERIVERFEKPFDILTHELQNVANSISQRLLLSIYEIFN